ncbi:hypothetical protein [Kitasatospora sp. NPDC096204]|uniref:hypothetical protein n=1 Tax=Kitasatospora sp. NPDC096204 TaxID=3364094 RepID=UPI0037FE27D1
MSDVHAVNATGRPLPERHVAVMDRVGLGLTDAAIGAALNLTFDTVKSHLHQAYDRLGRRTGSRPSPGHGSPACSPVPPR